MFKNKLFLVLFIIFVAVFLDLLSKILVFDALAKFYTNKIIIIDNFFNLVQVENRGISFGMFNDWQYGNVIFPIISLVIILILLFFIYKTENYLDIISYSAIIGGALGNVIDRLIYGAVRDFLDFQIYDYHWPAFNLADSFVCIGVLILIIKDIKLSLFNKRKIKL